MKHTISILVKNEPGILSSVCDLFSTRGYNIESLSVAPTIEPAFSRITIVTVGDEFVIEQIADKCNIYQSTYNHYETGYSLIKIIPAYSICKTYNISFVLTSYYSAQ